MTDIIGKSLGRYQIIEQLGEGGMAIVYKAYDTRLETDVAVKVIRTENLAPVLLEKALKRFEREAKALARLTHPNIVKVTDYGEYDGKPYLVMPYLPAGTLRQRMGRPIPWQEAARLLLPIMRALDFAHRQNMIHRDVKPSNILITEDGELMLSDFGVAKVLDLEGTADLTGTGMGVGTPEFFAPEQWTGKATPQSDQYAVSVVLYEMLTGRKPYSADTPVAILLKQATEPLPRPSLYVPGLPNEVEKLITRGLAKDPEDRFASMGDYASALEAVLRETRGALPVAGTKTNLRKQVTDDDAKTLSQSDMSDVVRPRPASNRSVWGRVVGVGVVIILLLLGALSLFSPEITGLASLLVAPTSASSAIVPTDQPTSAARPTAVPATDTPVSPLPTSTRAIPTPTVSPGYVLEDCRFSDENICLYSISPQTDSVIVALKYKSGIDESRLPYLLVGTHIFNCELLLFYPGRLYCTGPSISGDFSFVLRYSDTENICSGDFRVNEYVAPVPTKKKGSSGGKYP
ncbi:MAG: serine/threonine protein kinase [Chloroflexota bacterium]